MLDSEAFFRVLQPYHAAFVDPVLESRLALLRAALTPSAQICGPSTIFTGYDAISEKITAFQRNWPACSLALLASPLVFDRAAHFPMAIVDPGGAVRASGNAVVELASDGRIQRVMAFWGQHQPLPASWPWRLVSPAAPDPRDTSAA